MTNLYSADVLLPQPVLEVLENVNRYCRQNGPRLADLRAQLTPISRQLEGTVPLAPPLTIQGAVAGFRAEVRSKLLLTSEGRDSSPLGGPGSLANMARVWVRANSDLLVQEAGLLSQLTERRREILSEFKLALELESPVRRSVEAAAGNLLLFVDNYGGVEQSAGEALSNPQLGGPPQYSEVALMIDEDPPLPPRSDRDREQSAVYRELFALNGATPDQVGKPSSFDPSLRAEAAPNDRAGHRSRVRVQWDVARSLRVQQLETGARCIPWGASVLVSDSDVLDSEDSAVKAAGASLADKAVFAQVAKAVAELVGPEVAAESISLR